MIYKHEQVNSGFIRIIVNKEEVIDLEILVVLPFYFFFNKKED